MSFLVHLRALAPLCAAALLCSCAHQIRQEAETSLRRGEYEKAASELNAGLKKYPESATLRAGAVSSRTEASNRLAEQATQQRDSGRLQEADKTLGRALAIDPRNDRLIAMRSGLAADARVQAALAQANELEAAGKKGDALAKVETALRDAPQHPGLLALQKKLHGEIRAEADAMGKRALAETRPISLDFRNAPLSTVLDAITRGSGVNFILDRDVKQDSRVTIYLRSATVEDAIDLVTGANQLARRIVDTQTVLVYPNTPEKLKEHQEQVIRVFHLSHVDAKSTAALFKSLLRVKDPFVDERANLVALRESADIVALAERLVTLHDVADAEVMLEVEVLEITASRLTDLGVNFPNSLSLTPLPGAGGLTVRSLRNLNSSQVGVGVSPLVLNLKREVGDVNILANPRIRAKNREKARILIGDKVPVITSTANATGFVSESVNYLDVGLKLDVEPSVSPDDEVSIKLGLEVSSIAREVRSASGTLAYQLGTRNANTTLRLKDGETQLLAGLISNEDRTAANRVPGLGDLPVAGRLFSNQQDDYRRTELVLAITPRVIRGAPRPDVSQAELWVGTEIATRLRASPARRAVAALMARDGEGGAVPAAQPARTGAASGASQLPVPAGPPKLAWQAPTDVKVGEVFTIRLELESATPLRGAPIEIGFSPQQLEIVEVAEGRFFRQADGPTSFSQVVNVETGRINVGVLRSDASGAKGRGSVLELKVKAKATGTAQLSLISARLLGQSGPAGEPDFPTLKVDVK